MQSIGVAGKGGQKVMCITSNLLKVGNVYFFPKICNKLLYFNGPHVDTALRINKSIHSFGGEQHTGIL